MPLDPVTPPWMLFPNCETSEVGIAPTLFTSKFPLPPPQTPPPWETRSGRPLRIWRTPEVNQPPIALFSQPLEEKRLPGPKGMSYTQLTVAMWRRSKSEGAYSASRSKLLGTSPALFWMAPYWSRDFASV